MFGMTSPYERHLEIAPIRYAWLVGPVGSVAGIFLRNFFFKFFNSSNDVIVLRTQTHGDLGEVFFSF